MQEQPREWIKGNNEEEKNTEKKKVEVVMHELAKVNKAELQKNIKDLENTITQEKINLDQIRDTDYEGDFSQKDSDMRNIESLIAQLETRYIAYNIKLAFIESGGDARVDDLTDPTPKNSEIKIDFYNKKINLSESEKENWKESLLSAHLKEIEKEEAVAQKEEPFIHEEKLLTERKKKLKTLIADEVRIEDLLKEMVVRIGKSAEILNQTDDEYKFQSALLVGVRIEKEVLEKIIRDAETEKKTD